MGIFGSRCDKCGEKESDCCCEEEHGFGWHLKSRCPRCLEKDCECEK